MFMDDHRLAEAKAMAVDKLLSSLKIENLVRLGAERTGPCPRPGCGGDDRFSISTRNGLFQCRICGAKGDQVALVQLVLGYSFPEALDWLCGPQQKLSPDELEKRQKQQEETREQSQKKERDFRARAVAEARAIWRAALPAENSAVRGYLGLRGLGRDVLPTLPRCLRFAPDLPYMVQAVSGDWIEAHRGPAMVAVIQRPDGHGSAIHRTWFDLDAPQGKVRILHPETGAVQKRKKTWGAKKGGAIRLTDHQSPDMVMGEGIETTGSAMVAGSYPGAAFWAGVDLGNMAGRRLLGVGLKFAGLPDLDDAKAFVPPPWVRRLIYVMDGDSEPRLTRAQLESGLRRAMALRPGLQGFIARCPTGADLNDVLLQSESVNV